MKFKMSCFFTLHISIYQIWLIAWEENVNARRTTYDERQPIAIGHLSNSGDQKKVNLCLLFKKFALEQGIISKPLEYKQTYHSLNISSKNFIYFFEDD